MTAALVEGILSMANVYCICFPNGKLYVGYTSRTPARRFKEHVAAARNGAPWAVHLALYKYGPGNIQLVTLIEGVSCPQAKDLEIWWISRLGAFGPGGYNETPGGDGRTEYTEEQKAVAAEATRKQMNDPIKGPAHRAKINKALRTPEARAANAERARKQMSDPAAREIMVESAHRQWRDPEFAKIRSEASTIYWQDPTRRAKSLAQLKEASARATHIHGPNGRFIKKAST